MGDVNKLDGENERRLEATIALVGNVVQTGYNALYKFPENQYSMDVFLYLNYLERLVSNLDSVATLLKSLKSKPNIETSIGLILRSSLLDFMTIAYLYSYTADISDEVDKEGEEKLDNQLKSLLADQVIHTLKYLKLSLNHHLITIDEYNATINNLHSSYPFLFKESGIDYLTPEKSIITVDLKSPKDYFKRINSHPLTKKFSKSYDLYTYYSKYEHFGIMTHHLQRQGLDHDLANIIASLKYLIRGIGACMAYLSYPEEKIRTQRDEIQYLQDEFDKIGEK